MSDAGAAPFGESGFFVPFSLAPSQGRYVEDGFAVYPNSLLFRAGSYADKNFEMSAAELGAAARGWTPISGNIEHKSFLKGRAGVIPAVWTDEDDSVLRGVVKVPLALDCLLHEDEKRVSLEIDRATKRPKAFALTTSPRVMDAALMSAVLMSLDESAEFRRHDTFQGQRGLQEMHDTAVRFGAVCRPDNTARMASEHEHATIQAMHDVACDHGARCERAQRSEPAQFGNDAARNGSSDQGETGAMKIKDRLKGGLLALFVKAGVPENEAEAELDRVDLGLDEANGDLGARFARLRLERTQDQAEAWAENEIRAGRALPAERSAMIAAFVQASKDDEALPTTIIFSTASGDSTSGAVTATRLETLQALFSARRPHDLLAELVRDGGAPAAALFNQLETAHRGTKRPITPERRSELLRATPEGRAALASRSGN